MEGLAFTSDGTLYGASDENKTLVIINRNSAFSSPVGGILFNMGVPLEPLDLGMAATCDGELLVTSAIQQSLFRASLNNGRLEQIGNPGSLGAPITDIAIWGEHAYGLGQGQTRDANDNLVTSSPNLYRIDLETATATLIGPLGAAAGPYANAGLAFDETGQLWAITDRLENGNSGIRSEILRIDLATGAATKSADADRVGFESLAIAVPGGCGSRGEVPGDAVAIPSHSPGSLAWLLTLLLATGFWTLHSRQR